MQAIEAVRLTRETDRLLEEIAQRGTTNRDLAEVEKNVHLFACVPPHDQTGAICKEWLVALDVYRDSIRNGRPAAYFEEMMNYTARLRQVIDPSGTL